VVADAEGLFLVTAGFQADPNSNPGPFVSRTWNYLLEFGITSRVVYAVNFLPATMSVASFDTALDLGDQQNNTCTSIRRPVDGSFLMGSIKPLAHD
jgi:hypothetical protein